MHHSSFFSSSLSSSLFLSSPAHVLLDLQSFRRYAFHSFQCSRGISTVTHTTFVTYFCSFVENFTFTSFDGAFTRYGTSAFASNSFGVFSMAAWALRQSAGISEQIWFVRPYFPSPIHHLPKM